MARKHKVQKAAVKGTRRSSKVARPLKTSPKPNPYPTEQLKRLFTETGKEVIQGIHFDINPEQLVKQGWKPWELRFGDEPFYFHAFPWAAKPKGQRIVAGDSVQVEDIVAVDEGNKVDHPSDQAMRVVTFGVYRNGEKLDIDLGEVEFYQDDTFLYWIDFETAVARLVLLIGKDRPISLVSMVGDKNSDPSTYGLLNWEKSEKADQPHEGRDPALPERALANAFAVNSRWASVVGELRTSGVKLASEQRVGWDVLDYVERAIDNATAFGYLLAKAEFAPHVEDTLAGKKADRDRKAGGQTRKKQILERADRWRVPALALAQERRAKNPKLGQKALATIILEAPFMQKLLTQGLKELGRDAVVTQVKRWEISGFLPLTARNRALKARKG